MKVATLFIFSGLPGSGKSTLSRMLATHIGAAYLRIDTIEQALRDLCAIDVAGEGYRLAYRVAADNLRLGTNVVADSCNPVELTRREWRRVALDSGARYVDIELVCSDREEHRRRVENRVCDVPGLKAPTWRDVTERVYDDWAADRVVVDTFGRPADETFAELLRKLPPATATGATPAVASSGGATGSTLTMRGSCLCGGVRFAVHGPAAGMSSCYCGRCRKAYAAPLGTIVVVRRDDFSYLSGREFISPFQSSRRVNRPFCSRCGSRLPIVEEWDPLVGIPAGLLDDDPGVRNSAHIFVASKAPWWEICDHTPQHPEWPPDEDMEQRFESISSDRPARRKR